MIFEILNNLKYRRIKSRYDRALQCLPRVKLSSNEKNCIIQLFKPLGIPVNPNWGGTINITYPVLSRCALLRMCGNIWKCLSILKGTA